MLEDRFVRIPHSLPTYEANALLVSHIAFPTQSEENERYQAKIVLCNMALHAISIFNPDWINQPMLVKPAYLLGLRNAKRVFKVIKTRIRNRIISGHIMQIIINSLSEGKRKITSLSQASEMIITHTTQGYGVNLLARTWYPSLPVIHASLSIFQFVLDTSNNLDLDIEGVPLDLMLHSPLFLSNVLESSQRLETLFSSTFQLNQYSKNILRFRFD